MIEYNIDKESLKFKIEDMLHEYSCARSSIRIGIGSFALSGLAFVAATDSAALTPNRAVFTVIGTCFGAIASAYTANGIIENENANKIRSEIMQKLEQ